ncbi:hypothetical protein BDM02DRAFT_1372944 [Thelephora ganbajun]|uniref:Uncharacterized protein n=1 Tax=Thelephora ganbajun TaxID=370292 RepID=A0ACB6Z244_THEGA|nr:hypothetical protein BDM02DRAFT_1372944 [Thelephora ganbajun]
MDHIHRMASGVTPFFPTTLSLVYDKLVEKSLTKPISFGLGFDGCTGDQSPIDPTPPLQASGSTPAIDSPPTINSAACSSNSQALASTTGPITLNTASNLTRLKCALCGKIARLQDLYDGLRCPVCPGRCTRRRPLMVCSSCNASRSMRGDDSSKKGRRERIM